MQIDFSTVLKGMDDKDIPRDNGDPLTLGFVCRAGLLNAKGSFDAATHLDRYDLGCAINYATPGASLKITNKQLTMLRDSVSAIWPTGIAAPALRLFQAAEAEHNKPEAAA